MTLAPARMLASAGTAGAGVVTGTAAFLIVRGLPGVLYAAGICLAALVGAAAIRAGRSGSATEPEAVVAPRARRRRGALRVVPETKSAEPTAVGYPDAIASDSELEEHRVALANLGAQLARTEVAASRNAQRLERRICELEAERDGLLALVAEERARFEQTLEVVCEGIGAELAELEPALEALTSA